MKAVKILVLLLSTGLLIYGGREYYRYVKLQKNMEKFHHFREGLYIIIGLGPGMSMSRSMNRYGEVWPENRARLDTLLQEIKRHLKADKLVLEEYGYGFRVDTLKINDENVGGLCVEYKIYSYGPNRKDDKLKYLPFNQDPIGDGRLEVSFKEISFWDYLFMDKDFDIVCLYQKYCFDCRDKMLLDRMVLDPKAGSLNLVYSKEMMKYQPGKPVEMDYDELYEQFNLALSKIQGRLEEKYPGNAVKDLAFNYNGKSVKCLCKYKLSASQVAEIEKLLTGELNNATKNIGMAAFYMRVPTVSE